MISVVREAFTGLMGALKQTRKQNKEGKNGERNPTSSEQSNAKKGKAKTNVISKAQQKKNSVLKEELLTKRSAKLEEAKKKSS